METNDELVDSQEESLLEAIGDAFHSLMPGKVLLFQKGKEMYSPRGLAKLPQPSPEYPSEYSVVMLYNSEVTEFGKLTIESDQECVVYTYVGHKLGNPGSKTVEVKVKFGPITKDIHLPYLVSEAGGDPIEIIPNGERAIDSIIEKLL